MLASSYRFLPLQRRDAVTIPQKTLIFSQNEQMHVDVIGNQDLIRLVAMLAIAHNRNLLALSRLRLWVVSLLTGDREWRKKRRRKRGRPEEDARGTFWRGTAIDMETRLRVGRAIAKTEEEVAPQLMEQIKKHHPEEKPPVLATDGKGAYREAMLCTWGTVPE
jgi:hypothetical protein